MGFGPVVKLLNIMCDRVCLSASLVTHINLALRFACKPICRDECCIWRRLSLRFLVIGAMRGHCTLIQHYNSLSERLFPISYTGVFRVLFLSIMYYRGLIRSDMNSHFLFKPSFRPRFPPNTTHFNIISNNSACRQRWDILPVSLAHGCVIEVYRSSATRL